MSTKRILAFLLAVVMTVIPMSALANEAELGSYDNPWLLSTTSVRFAVTVEPESEAWVQVDDSNGSTLTVGYATTADYMIVYCRQPYYPETETGDNTLTVTMVNGADMFSVYNAGTEAVTVYMALTAGAGSDVAYGTVDNPEPVTLAKDWFGNLAADMYVDLEAGSQGYYYTCTAPADGVITVTVGAVDAEYNSVGWMFGVNNMTSYVYGDYHFSDDEPFCNYDTVKVSQGDVVEVFVNTYDPNDMWNPPAATVNTQFSFYGIGTYECPDEPVMGTNEADIAEGSFGYNYTWTAEESGYLTVSMTDESWTYGINVERANGEFYYGDTHYSDDETVVPSETVTVYAGDKVNIVVNTYDPESWTAPAGVIAWEMSFVAEELEPPVVPDTPLGAYDNPYELFLGGDNLGVYVEPGAEAWIKVDSTANTVVTVGYATNPNFMLVYCRQPYYPETETGNNTLSVAMVDGADMFTVYNSGEEGVTVYMALTQGEGGDVTYGTLDNPEPVTLMADWFGGLNASVSAELAAGNQGYYYTLTVPADGLLTVGVNAMDAEYNFIGWIYNVNIARADGTYYYGDNHWSDDDPVVSYEKLNVCAGDVVTVFVAPYDPADMWNNPAGTVMADFSLEAVGTWGNPDTNIEAGEQETTLDAGNNGYYYIWTATEDGAVTVTMNGDNWTYNVNAEKIDGTFYYGDNHAYTDDPAVPSETLKVSAGDRVTIMVGTYSADTPWEAPAGTVSWSLAFTAGTGETPVEKQEGYAEPGIALEVGTADYELDATYKYTVYFFEPTETGKYTFTASNGLIALVSYNGMWVTIEPTAETVTSSTFEWECGSVGQSILVAAFGDEATISITVEKEAVEIIEIPWTPYENVVAPESFTFVSNGNLLQYVDTLDDICNVAVLGEDGFYHLDSADGPILYVDLDDTTLSLADAMGYGQLRYTLTVDGEVVAKIDYNEAFGAYVNCADEATLLYPLTEDLMAIYKNVGIQQGWYGESGWIGGDLEDSWMFACYYQAENTKVEINVNDNDVLTDGKTGFTEGWNAPANDVVLIQNTNCTVAGMDVTLLYALGEATKINSVTVDLYFDKSVMIGYPEGQAIVLISTDGETYTEVGKFDLTAADFSAPGTVSNVFAFDAVEAAYVKVLLHAGSNEAVLGDSPADDKFFWEFISVAEFAVGEVPAHEFGDINGDGKANTADYVLLKRHIMLTYELNEDQLTRADINGDGEIRTQDYVLLKRLIMGTWTPKN